MTPFDAKARADTIAERMWGIRFINPRTVDQVKEMIVEALFEARASALEEAAKVAEEIKIEIMNGRANYSDIPYAIRALK